ncbi:interactor of HORMAD1 protein 1 isoform X2 [Pseudophryne corroboree]|uniref:interactor of HORMAD1 protein 1 isoform X2 n=1 Tax=Pseudophryne corroboree TaxID=495146 RepID=UPI003081B37D
MTNKPTQNAGVNDHGSLTDSQFLFGSQFCPESSQSGSLDYSTQGKYQKTAKLSSQDSNPSIYQKYQAKPPLYNIDCKERGTFQSFGSSKAKDIMEQFEESKRKTKEKQDSEQLNQLICNIQVTLQDLKMTFCHIEENTDVRFKSILDSIDAVSKELQENILSYRESIVKEISSKSDMEQALLDLEKKILLKDAEMTDVKSNVQSLLSGIEVVKVQQSQKHLELSEKITLLSDSIKSSEDKILSEIHKIHLASRLALNMKNKTTQTSPAYFQDPSAQRDTTSQVKTMSTRPDGSPLSQTYGQSTCAGISNTLSLQHRENLCVTELKAINTCNATSVGNIVISSRDEESTDVLQKSFKASDAKNQTTPFRRNITTDDIAVKSVHSLPHLCQHDHGIPTEKDSPLENTDPNCGKENMLIVNRRKKYTNNPKRRKTNKSRKNIRKKRTGLSTNNSTHASSRAIGNSAQYKSGKELFTHEPENSVEVTQHSLKLYTDSCKSSLSIVPAPKRKTQQRKSLKFQLLRSHQPLEQSTNEGTCAGDGDGLFQSAPTQSDVPLWDKNNLHCDKEGESNMRWFMSSSPLLGGSSIHPVQKTGQKSFHSLFFDSSDNSD